MAAKSLEQLKEEATNLGIDYPQDIKAADLTMLIKGKTGETINTPETTTTTTTTQTTQTQKEVPNNVTFSPEQLQVINAMLQNAMAGQRESVSPNSAVSLYDVRDPKKIETVNVRRFDGKFVMGFKNLQNDPYKKTPKYLRYGVDPVRKLVSEPYVTLLLSSDGKNIEEKEVLLVDYTNNRETFQAKVLEIKEKEVIHDHGLLGRTGGDMGVAVDEKGIPEKRLAIKAESKSVDRRFIVQLPGFTEKSEFISDFLA